MNVYKYLDITGEVLENKKLEYHLEKFASTHILKNKSNKDTYPVPRMIENYEAIKEVYNLLNNHLKQEIAIHPAGEWLLDNFYVIEEVVKFIQKELTLKKYTNFVGINNEKYKGFARIYTISAEIVAYTDNKINKSNLESLLQAYQIKKELSMDEIWNIGVFLQIVLIEKIRHICEAIYIAQMQKEKAKNIVNNLVENKLKSEFIYKKRNKLKNKLVGAENSFIEYLSYLLKKQGKRAYGYLNALEEIVEKTGTTVSDIIKKEHFNIAIKKVSMGNAITSIKEIQQINFLEIFENINCVEEVLKQDPANVYEKMDYKTKESYRNKIKEISKKTKISEMYIAKKLLKLAQNANRRVKEHKEETLKKTHIGYYLISKGIDSLYCSLQQKKPKTLKSNAKAKLYIILVLVFTIMLSLTAMYGINYYTQSVWLSAIGALVVMVPVSELVVQIIQYVLSKLVKPKIIPKIDFYKGLNNQTKTFVIIPTIIKSKAKVKELIRKLEVFYLANKSDNLYFALLGDCSESNKREEPFDKEIVEEGKCLVNKLNQKYKKQEEPIFYFLYRNRTWNQKENCYLGWERKRGLITEFNEYILKKKKDNFRCNTIEEYRQKIKTNNINNAMLTGNLEEKSSFVNTQNGLENIKYVITLDSDTDLNLNSAFELVGAMEHILNEPVLNKQKNMVIDGYAIIQPRIGINLNVSYKNLFTKIFAGSGGIDSYTNAISDFYQDNFKEGIYTGKGIYNLEIFSKILTKQIPENKVLSHDLLEGCYLRCGLATDILLMDGYPTKYISFMSRLSRWIRGDWQILKWAIKSPLNLLSKYKILDNLRKSTIDFFVLVAIIYFCIIDKIFISKWGLNLAIFGTIVIYVSPFVLEIIDKIIFKKFGEKQPKSFTPKIDGIKGALIRAAITIGCLPYKAFVLCLAQTKTLYRMLISKKHLLEWTTSEEAEIKAKTDIVSYYKIMFINIIMAFVLVVLNANVLTMLIALLWVVAPAVMCIISKEKSKKSAIDKLSKSEKAYALEVAKKTWKYFEDYLIEKNNYLIPDNYQEDRIPIVINRTSSTNIGLSLLAVISAYDFNFISKAKAINFLQNIINTIESLAKWNGHLYNWYNIYTKDPLIPRYISTVDSGNFVGYLYVVKSFLEEPINQDEKNKEIINILKNQVEKLIQNTDFGALYSKEKRLLSIGFNVEENKLTNSYYDLLASEARQASLVAIAKGDVPVKHWNCLNRTMTNINKYKGLISWSGTAFEYLMPNINIPRYEGSLLDESCKFLIMSQIEYSKRLGIPWGISESAFNAKDLNANYQYKAFGIPWLGLKRGLADEMVIASYGSILAIVDKPKEVIENLKLLESQKMYGKYGFYEAIDYTPTRLNKGQKGTVVKTYMAHHQGLILLAINNLFRQNILQKRFIKNPQIEAVSIILQEKMPDKFIITKENKEKVEKLKYKDYENYLQREYNKVDEKLITGNIISNANYTVAIDQKGKGVSKYGDIFINRYKKTDDYPQGIFFYIKNLSTKKIWSTNYNEYIAKPDKYKVIFTPEKSTIERTDKNIKTKVDITVAPNEPVEIRKVQLENLRQHRRNVRAI